MSDPDPSTGSSFLLLAKTVFFFFFLFESLESAAPIHTHSQKLEMKAVYFVNEFRGRFVAAINRRERRGSQESGPIRIQGRTLSFFFFF